MITEIKDQQRLRRMNCHLSAEINSLENIISNHGSVRVLIHTPA